MVHTFTFHYVSISTCCWLYFESYTFIYIPLCIYFNIIRPIRIRITFKIYIPLCIYFNWGRMLRDILLRINLHSTMYLFQPCAITGTTLLPIHLHSTMYLFQQIYLKHIINRHINLHSTMYLFQPSDRKNHEVAHLNLHSTMYLFQPFDTSIILILFQFTFHYVSISTGDYFYAAQIGYNLHSTMYLFQLYLVKNFARVFC